MHLDKKHIAYAMKIKYYLKKRLNFNFTNKTVKIVEYTIKNIVLIDKNTICFA